MSRHPFVEVIMQRALRRSSTVALAAAAALSLAGCAGDLNPMRDVLVGAGIGPQPMVAPDFVAGSRPPGGPDYVPIGLVPPERELTPKSPGEVAEAEEELRRLVETNAARAASARRLSLGPAPEPVRVEPAPAIERELAAPVAR